MKENNTIMNMVMRHLFERCKSEFIKNKYMMTLFLKSNLPTISLSNMQTKTFNLVTILILKFVYACNCT